MPNYLFNRVEHFTGQLICPNCGKEWEVEFVVDMGCASPIREDDIYCPDCGTKGE